LTAIVQSSSATVGITMGLAATGGIDFRTAAALVLGENIGTTITAYLASLGTSINARRAAYAHILIKVIAVSIAITIFPWYIRFVEAVVRVNPDLAVPNGDVMTYPYVMRAIATSHSLFNIALTCLFLPFVSPLVRLLLRIAPDKPVKEPARLTYLDVRMLDTPALGIEQSRKETLNMAQNVEKMLEWLREIIADGDATHDDKRRRLFRREEIMDNIQQEIAVFLGSLLTGSVSHDVMERARAQLRMADEYETLSDYIVHLLRAHDKLDRHGVGLSPEGRKQILQLHDRVAGYIRRVNAAVEEWAPDILTRAHADGLYIDRLMKDFRRDHTNRIATEQSHPLSNLVFPDILNAYRRMKDHALNIAEALAGEK